MLVIFDLSTGQYKKVDEETFYNFINIIYDEKEKELTINQKLFGSGIPLYFLLMHERVYICDSLKQLKEMSEMKFMLNRKMLPFFFYNGFLPGVHTLVEGVYKLPPKTTVVMRKEGIKVQNVEYRWTNSDYSGQILEQKYEEAFVEAVSTCVTECGEKEINMAISSGYDSNYLLYLINKMYSNRMLSTFSVGGVHGINETSQAEEIIKSYQGVKFYKAEVSSETFNKLDDIVYRLEGSVYERGIFLQYELARILHQKQCTHIICGDCADQVFHVKAYDSIPDNTFLYGYRDTPYEMASYVVLRKSALMLKSFGIKGIYPFLNPKVIEIGYKTREINGYTKEFHKEQCRRILDKRVLERIDKKAGTTSLSTLFEQDYDCKKEIVNCKFYDPSFKITQKYSLKEAEYDYYLSLLYLESFERQFCDFE